MQKPFEAFQSFEILLKTAGIQSDFKVLSSLSDDRVHQRRLQAIHNASGIVCSIQFDSNFELTQSSQTIRNCIMHAPICKSRN